MFHKDNSVCTGQVETEATDVSGQQKDINGWIIVEAVDNTVPISGWHTSVQTQVSDTGHVYSGHTDTHNTG